MFKLNRLPQRLIEKQIAAEYVDWAGNLWSYLAYVQINSKYEVLDVVLSAIEVEDINYEPVAWRSIATEGVLQTLRDHAADLALEKVEAVDFEEDEL